MSTAPDSARVAATEAAIRDRRAAIIDELGAEAVLWLAAPPLWTAAVAEATQFPGRPLLEFVRRACDAGWCQVRGTLHAPSPDLRFWMADEIRREVLDVLRDSRGAQELRREAQRIAARVAAASGKIIPALPEDVLAEDVLPAPLQAWTELMGSGDRGDSARLLLGLTAQAVAERDLGRAQDLVAAGEAVAAVTAGTAEQALGRARRMLALGMRRRQDERAIGEYLNRPELSERGRPPAGPGIRLGAAPARARRGRQDDADPLHRVRPLCREKGTAAVPGRPRGLRLHQAGLPSPPAVQLLLELAEELSLHAAVSDRAEYALGTFRRSATRAHEAVSGLREADGAPLENPLVAQAVDNFGDVLAQLGNVLLILDTCEELAKADMGNPGAPAVRETFKILERLHARASNLHVLFAGRRPLPSHGYLAVQPVAGFTVDEARRYLATSRRPIPADLADAMIRQSPAVDGAVPPAGQLPDRVSPFDLALYAAWAREDPDLSVTTIEGGSDAYVKGRIIERLGDPLVKRALPILATAGRCRVSTTAEFLERNPAGLDCTPAELGRRLAGQEWIDAEGDPPTHITARPALARRLRRYFGAEERRAEFSAQTAALASLLRIQIGAVPLAEIDVDELIAALRLSSPPDAAALSDSLAERAMEPPGHWTTIGNMTRRILGEWDEEEWPTTPALRATVVAASIAASRREFPLFDARSPWETVRRWAGRHPDPVSRQSLQFRAALGLLPYAPDDESLWGTLEGNPPEPVGDVLAAAFADVVYRLLEAGLYHAAERLDRSMRLIPMAPDLSDSSLVVMWRIPRIQELLAHDRLAQIPWAPVVWSWVARARLLAFDDQPEAGRLLEDAKKVVAAARRYSPRSWPDWIQPEDLTARVFIEHCLIAPPGGLTVLADWEAYAADHLGTIDGERLASLCLRIRLRHGVVDASVAERWEAADSYILNRVPSCTAHDLVPPLFVSVAEAWMSARRPQKALALLDRRRAEALDTRQDDLTVRHADAATLAVIRRLRLSDRISLIYGLATDDAAQVTPGLRGLALRTRAILHSGPIPTGVQSTDDPEVWHALWQSSETENINVVPVASSQPRPARSTSDVADIEADLAEMRALTERESSADQENLPESRSSLPDWGRIFSDWLTNQREPPVPAPPVRSAQPHYELRAAMRMAALTGDQFRPPPGVPPRLLAEMAFEEAELTALRLRDVAVRLFTIAADAYAEAGDVLGELLAHVSVCHARLHDPSRGGIDMDAPRTVAATLDRLRQQDDSLTSILATPAQHPGEEDPFWGYWADAVRDATRAPAPDVRGPATARSGRRRWSLPALAIPALTAVVGGIAFGATSAAGHLQLSWVLGLVNGLLLGLLIALGIPAVRLARGRGVGTFRPGDLAFKAQPVFRPVGESADATDVTAIRLDVLPRPWRTAPLRAKTVLWFVRPAVSCMRLPRPIGQSRRREAAYIGSISAEGSPPRPVAVHWDRPNPDASPRWWRRGRDSALGLITVSWSENPVMTEPWERVLVTSLAPEAAGRIEWIRIVRGVTPEPKGRIAAETAMLDAPRAWHRVVGDAYGRSREPENVGSRHVIGRAIKTSAGPVMDVTGEALVNAESVVSDSSRRQLLTARDLHQGLPSIVILQAEPADGDVIGTDPPDDQAEKLRLAAALASDGVPAVLLLPILPANTQDALSDLITAPARQAHPSNAQVLLRQLRKAIAPHVPPQVLDDVVLFLNESVYH